MHLNNSVYFVFQSTSCQPAELLHQSLKIVLKDISVYLNYVYFHLNELLNNKLHASVTLECVTARNTLQTKQIREPGNCYSRARTYFWAKVNREQQQVIKNMIINPPCSMCEEQRRWRGSLHSWEAFVRNF